MNEIRICRNTWMYCDGNCDKCDVVATDTTDIIKPISNATPYTECVVNLYTETKLRFVLDECIDDEELIEKILKALDEVSK